MNLIKAISQMKVVGGDTIKSKVVFKVQLCFFFPDKILAVKDIYNWRYTASTWKSTDFYLGRRPKIF